MSCLPTRLVGLGSRSIAFIRLRHTLLQSLGYRHTSAMSVKGEVQHGSTSCRLRYPSVHAVMDHTFFLSESEFRAAREETRYDIVIIGSGFCALAVAERALKNNPACKILILERGTFLLPEHLQNLSQPYASILRGLSEAYPWTLAEETARGKRGVIRRLHGTIPFFGGCSTLWSAWCPRPTLEEMHGWPEETKENVHKYFESAEELLHVQKVNDVDNNDSHARGERPVYGLLQNVVGELIEHAPKIENVYRAEPAVLACDSKDVNRINFQKFSVPGELLGLSSKQSNMHGDRAEALLHIAINCAVEKIHQQDGVATALQTTRGDVQVGDAHLVVAMGTLPATTLVHNSFPLDDVHEREGGERFSAHFMSVIIARIPRGDLEGNREFGDLEMGAYYVAGAAGGDYKKQFHIQISALSDRAPSKNARAAHRYMPDVVATASMQQLETSKDHVIFVCVTLGELDADNENNWFRHNPDDSDITANSILQVSENDNDVQTWDAMDKATFDILEKTVSPLSADRVQYWHGPSDSGSWESRRPGKAERRVDALVHDSSTLYIGEKEPAPVDLNYCLRGTENVYITGGGLWPRGGSWNPTMVMVAMAQHLADQLTNKPSYNDARKEAVSTHDRGLNIPT